MNGGSTSKCCEPSVRYNLASYASFGYVDFKIHVYILYAYKKVERFEIVMHED